MTHSGFDTDLRSLPRVLDRRAAGNPDDVFIDFVESGSTYTYISAWRETQRWRERLAAIGVEPGTPVLAMLPTCPASVFCWIALARLRAIEVPINVDLWGKLLGHIISDSACELLICDQRYLGELDEPLGAGIVTRCVVLLDPLKGAAELDGARMHDVCDGVLGEASPLPSAGATSREAIGDVVEDWDISSILYTSGTTGASKGVMVPWRQAHATVGGTLPAQFVHVGDCIYNPYPLCHVSGKVFIHGAAEYGIRVVVRARFSINAFWEDIREHGCTIVMLLGAMANFVMRQPTGAKYAENPLRDVLMLPLIREHAQFARQYNVSVRTTYNVTEIANCVTWEEYVTPETPCTTIGRVRDGFDARVVDGRDDEVPAGEAGELVVRSDSPWSLMAGYWRRPEATCESWRNLWFHTGDVVRVDDIGVFHFVDRLKVSIRRWGESISSAEIEEEVNSHPAVLESTAIAVPSDYSEHDVLVAYSVKPGASADPETVCAYLHGRVVRFMQPAYVRCVVELPKTPTGKIRKEVLRRDGVTADTYRSVST